MYLKRRVRHKDGKDHVYYTLTESIRVSPSRVVQRTVLHLGELNTTQVESWQRTVAAIHEDGHAEQLRLFTDREGAVPTDAADVVEVRLSSLAVRRPRRFGDCWVGCQIWEELGLRGFWEEALSKQWGQVPWPKVLELLAVNRLIAPRSELFVHEKWYGQTAMEVLLDADGMVAEKNRLYRCLDRLLAHKGVLEKHLAGRWQDLFGARYDLLLYDLTSTYFEGEMEGVAKARRGYSRDSRPDCKQLVIALIVTPEGFPLSYEVFAGNRADVTTLDEMITAVEGKYGRARRVWVFDRGIVSKENLAKLRERGMPYLVGTPKSRLKQYEAQLLQSDWKRIADKKVEVKFLPEAEEVYVLCRSSDRATKEAAMRQRQLRGLMRTLIRLRGQIRRGQLTDPIRLQRRLGRYQERYPAAWRYVKVETEGCRLRYRWDRTLLKLAQQRDGAYLLRAWNVGKNDPQTLWQMYVQLTEVEAAFRTLKSEVKIRPVWHHLPHRVEAHVLVAFLGYCLWVCLKARLRAIASSLTPWQALDLLGRIQLVEVWFQLKDGRWLCLPRITQPEPAQAVLLHQLGWQLPQQPPPRIYSHQIVEPLSQLSIEPENTA